MIKNIDHPLVYLFIHSLKTALYESPMNENNQSNILLHIFKHDQYNDNNNTKKKVKKYI